MVENLRITLFKWFHFNRLLFGIASAPEHFQCRMAEVTEGLEGVVCNINDLLVWGCDQGEHGTRLHAVLQRLEKAGITLNTDKSGILNTDKCGQSDCEILPSSRHIEERGRWRPSFLSLLGGPPMFTLVTPYAPQQKILWTCPC